MVEVIVKSGRVSQSHSQVKLNQKLTINVSYVTNILLRYRLLHCLDYQYSQLAVNELLLYAASPLTTQST
jgi:hypothetical protein